MNTYWLVMNAAILSLNTVAAVKDNSEVSWLMFTISAALTVFCVVRALV